jgi:hypothetical protein
MDTMISNIGKLYNFVIAVILCTTTIDPVAAESCRRVSAFSLSHYNEHTL